MVFHFLFFSCTAHSLRLESERGAVTTTLNLEANEILVRLLPNKLMAEQDGLLLAYQMMSSNSVVEMCLISPF